MRRVNFINRNKGHLGGYMTVSFYSIFVFFPNKRIFT